jgi:hypothetical protein
MVSTRLQCSVYVLVENGFRETRELAHADPKTDGKDGRRRRQGGTQRATDRPADPMPAEYWDAVLKDADARQAGPPIQSRKLSEIDRHVLRVSCSRCGRIVEIQKADACRLYGPDAGWKQVGQRLLDASCHQHTGRYEEDGCWPQFL